VIVACRLAVPTLIAAVLLTTACAVAVDEQVEEAVAVEEPAMPEPPRAAIEREVGQGELPVYVEVVDGAENVRGRDWTEVVVLDGGEALELRWWGGVEPCNVVAGVDVTYDADTVSVALSEGNAPTTGEGPVACIDLAR